MVGVKVNVSLVCMGSYMNIFLQKYPPRRRIHRCRADGELDEREATPSYFLTALSVLCKPHTYVCEIMRTQHHITGCVGQGSSAGMEQNSAISSFENSTGSQTKDDVVSHDFLIRSDDLPRIPHIQKAKDAVRG